MLLIHKKKKNKGQVRYQEEKAQVRESFPDVYCASVLKTFTDFSGPKG